MKEVKEGKQGLQMTIGGCRREKRQKGRMQELERVPNERKEGVGGGVERMATDLGGHGEGSRESSC